MKKGRVALKGRLFRGQTPLGAIRAKGQARKLDELMEEVLRQAFSILPKE